MLAKIKWNIIENIISEVLKTNEIIHKDFTTFLMNKWNYHYRELKENIRMIKIQKTI